MELKNERAKACCHLLNGKDIETVVFFKAQSGEKFSKKWHQAIHIMIIMDGVTYISYGIQKNLRLSAGDMLIIPPHTEIYFDVLSSLRIVHFNILDKYNFCRGFSLSTFLQQLVVDKQEKHHPVLKAHKIIIDFVTTMNNLVKEGIQCRHYFDLKQQELLYYLSLFYDAETLRVFFLPTTINTGNEFQKIIYSHLDEIKTIKDVQRLTNYSYSGVKKKFEKLFGMSFTEWLTQQKSYQVYQTISCSYKTFKEIAKDLGFASSSHLNLFCKKTYKMSPSEIRKRSLQKTL